MVLATIGWLIGLAAMIWVIYDVFVNHKGMSMGKKVLWTIFAILFSIITAIVYYFIVYKRQEEKKMKSKNVCDLCDDTLERKDSEALNYCDLCNEKKIKEKRLNKSCGWC